MDYRYVIVGGGMAADAAVKAVRKADPSGSMLLISGEQDEPYRRPPLSKGLWNGDDPAKVALGTSRHDLDVSLGDPAAALDLTARSVTLAGGKRFGYQRLLLATGAEARSLPPLPAGGPVLAYRKLADYRAARQRAGSGKRALVVGGGFIGSELAAGLAKAGTEVHMVFQEEAISALRFPPELARFVTQDYLDRGVKIHARSSVASAAVAGESVSVALTDGTEERFDLVAVGVGARPNVDLARGAGLAVDDGIVVDAQLRASLATGNGSEVASGARLGVYAAGDVASFPWPAPFSRGRIEHEDNAVSMGAHAGSQMVASYLSEHGGDASSAAGPAARPQETPYRHLPFFYSDLFDNGYEALGALDARLEMVSDWRDPCREGVVYYLDGDLLKGVMLWNTWGQVDEARELLLAAAPVDRAALIGRLPR